MTYVLEGLATLSQLVVPHAPRITALGQVSSRLQETGKVEVNSSHGRSRRGCAHHASASICATPGVPDVMQCWLVLLVGHCDFEVCRDKTLTYGIRYADIAAFRPVDPARLQLRHSISALICLSSPALALCL